MRTSERPFNASLNLKTNITSFTSLSEQGSRDDLSILHVLSYSALHEINLATKIEMLRPICTQEFGARHSSAWC